jgi:hypothetical protein
MGEGEHTIIGRIARERLNQIASRKLSTLGVPVRLGADRETLEGELGFTGRVVHPATGQTISRARFVVAGHDRLAFVDPPLAALGPVDFYAHERLLAFEQAVGTALAALHAQLDDLATRLRALQLDVAVDAERLQLRAVVKAPGHAFEILGAADGARVSRVAPVGGRPQEVAATFPPLDLRQFASGSELEEFLVASLPEMAAQPAARPEQAAVSAKAPRLEATPAPRNALTLSRLSQVFGAEALLPPNAMVELVQEFQYGGTRYRFVASREMGTRFKGRLIGPNGDVWSDRFELANFPGTHAVVARALGAPAAPAAGPAGVPAGMPVELSGDPDASGELPQHLLPQVSEVWVMNVVVEESGPEEIRYVGTDIDGKPYGAARVLKKSDFEAVFTQARGGWRLLIQIDQVQDGAVLYRQLDQARQPIGAPRKMAAAVLVANFVPEATAY